MSLLDHYKPLPADLNDPRIVEKFEELANEFLDKNETEGSLELLAWFDEQGPRLSDEVKARFRTTRSLLQFAALSALPSKAFTRFLERSVVQFLPSEQADVLRQIRIRLMAMDPRLADEEKERIKQALERNQERIGSTLVTRENESVPPTAGNWIAAYKNHVGAGERSAMTRSQFLFDVPEAATLSDDERNVLADTLYLYDLMNVRAGQPGAIDMLDPYLVLDDPTLLAETEEFEEQQKQEEQDRAQLQKELRKGIQEQPVSEPEPQPKPESTPASAPKKRSVPKPQQPKKSQPASVVPAPPAPKSLNQPKTPVTPKAAPASPAAPQVAPAPAPPKKAAAPEPYEGVNAAEDILRATHTELRLGTEQGVERLQAVYDDLKMFLQEQPDHMAEARKAWQKTDTYQLYKRLGEESMRSSKSVAQLAQEWGQLNQPTFSSREFALVAEISRLFTK